MMLINHSILNMPINEVYFGKSKELLDIENQLDIFRNKYMGKYLNINAGTDPDLIKLNRMIENFFGFGCCSIYMINSTDFIFGAMPLSVRLDVPNAKNNLIVDKTHYKFNKKSHISCFILASTGLMFNPEFLTSEIMAFLIHEIGHTFYSALSDKNIILSNMFKCLKMCLNLLSTASQFNNNGDIVQAVSSQVAYLLAASNFGIYCMSKFDNILREHLPILKNIMDTSTIIISTLFVKIPKLPYELLDKASLGIYTLLYRIKSLPYNIGLNLLEIPFAYDDERTADNFATMYGYGPELISGLQKFRDNNLKQPSKLDTIYNKIPVVSHIYNANMSITFIIFSIFDEHPNEISRARDQIALIEYELNKMDIDPKMKKDLEKDLKLCKLQLNKLIDLQDGIKNKNIIRNLWYRVLYKYTDSKTIKDILLNDIHRFERYDKTYNEKLNK